MDVTIVERNYTMRIATETYMAGNQLQNKKKNTKDIIIEKYTQQENSSSAVMDHDNKSNNNQILNYFRNDLSNQIMNQILINFLVVVSDENILLQRFQIKSEMQG